MIYNICISYFIWHASNTTLGLLEAPAHALRHTRAQERTIEHLHEHICIMDIDHSHIYGIYLSTYTKKPLGCSRGIEGKRTGIGYIQFSDNKNFKRLMNKFMND